MKATRLAYFLEGSPLPCVAAHGSVLPGEVKTLFIFRACSVWPGAWASRACSRDQSSTWSTGGASTTRKPTGKIDNGNDTAWAPFSLHTDKGKPEIRPYLFAVDEKTPPKKRNRRGQVEETCNPSGDSSENIMSDVCRYSRQRLHSHAVRDAGEHTALFPSDKNFFHCDAFVIKSRLSAHVRNTKSPSSLVFFGRWLP